ncbi:hypothetical protein ISCGN_027099 [Ixodes scapularis]
MKFLAGLLLVALTAKIGSSQVTGSHGQHGGMQAGNRMMGLTVREKLTRGGKPSVLGAEYDHLFQRIEDRSVAVMNALHILRSHAQGMNAAGNVQRGTYFSRCLVSGVTTNPEPCGFAHPRLAVRGVPVSGEKGTLVVELSPGYVWTLRGPPGEAIHRFGPCFS